MLDKVYEATKLICNAYSSQYAKFKTREDCEKYFLHKVKHTFAVAHTIIDIMIREDSIQPYLTTEVEELIELSAILHDLARFYQCDENGNFIPNYIFHHGAKAVDILKANPLFNNPILLFAISSHDLISIDYNSEYYTSLSDKDKKIADIVAKLLRDADKLENMENFILHGIPVFHHPNGSLTDIVRQSIIKKEFIDNKNLKTISDHIAIVISWVNDIYFDATKETIKKMNYVKILLNEFVKYGATAEDVKLVKEMVNYND